MRLVKAAEMQELDKMTTQDMGIPGVVLMENAARSASRIFLEHFSCPGASRVAIFCGRGNNGGDGYVMARYLQKRGLKITVVVLSEIGKISGDARTNLEIISRMGLELLEVPNEEEWKKRRGVVSESDFIIDGILGTGLNSPVRGFYRQVIEEINRSGRPVMAVDIPSGLNADNGQVMGAAVKADLTVTFGFPKMGQLVYPGASLVGRLARVDIGIPGAVEERIPAQAHVTEPRDFRDLFNSEKEDIHKGSRGHLLILAGSTGKTGAAALASMGALRAGAGLVTLGIPKSLNGIMEAKLTEAMTVPLPETAEGGLALAAEDEIKSLMDGKSALAIGAGLSTAEETVALVRRIVRDCPLPMVIDADGLNALDGDLGALEPYRRKRILTPHPGEMGRLTGVTTPNVQKDRIGTALGFVQQYGCYLVLKGARTLVAGPEDGLYVNPTGNRGLSSGGTGDVLTGLIGGYLARGWPMIKSALCGIYMHGLAADFLSEEMGTSGILAGDLLTVLPELTASLSRGEWPLERQPLHRDFYHSL
jgi:NAD(P)H-hydrate epimerase